MTDDDAFDSLFQKAVFAIDRGDENQLAALLELHPELSTRRLNFPGDWLTSTIGEALQSFFKAPYLLWFVAEDAVRNNSLPSNIDSIARIIIKKARSTDPENLEEQLDYAIKLVALSLVARESGVQIKLLDVLIDSGASTENVSDHALVNGNIEAAEHMIKRGARLTLSTAICIGRFNEAEILIQYSSADIKQFSLILAALRGNAKAVAFMISHGVDINKPSQNLYSHATALHHAVSAGSLETVRVLVEADADLSIKDTCYGGTPQGWAEYGKHTEIVKYLQQQLKFR